MELQLPVDHFDTLVFSGGGPASIAMIGCVRYLEHTGLAPCIVTLVGTSAGAIVSFLFALGLDSSDMLEWVARSCQAGGLTSLDGEHLLELPERLGIDDGSKLLECVRECLRERLGLEGITFMELAKRTGKHVVICAANITRTTREFFDVNSSPDVDVMLAIRMSLGIPILFTPVPFKGDLYIDGGMFDNFPIDYAFTAESTANNILGLRIIFPMQSTRTKHQDPAKLPALSEYLMMLVQAMLARAQPPLPAETHGKRVRVLDLHVSDALNERSSTMAKSCLNFSLWTLRFVIEGDAIRRLVQRGYDAIREAFEAGEAAGPAITAHNTPKGSLK
jgi:predicted acylesterase/phospholipase RssA